MTPGNAAIRAGVFQPGTGGRPAERINRLAAALATTERGRGLDLVVCPELFLTGYDIGDAVRDGAEPAGGPSASRLAEVARESGCAIVYGYAERDGDRLYNAAGIVDATGRAVATHRKTVLPPGFEARYFSTGQGLITFDCRGVRVAVLICYEVEFPEAVRAAAEAGAEAIAVPTALSDEWWSVAHRMIPTRAFENGVWLLYSNHAGREGRTLYLGASAIVAPDGDPVARAGAGEELIAAEIGMAPFAACRERLPYLRDVPVLRTRLRPPGADRSGAPADELTA